MATRRRFLKLLASGILGNAIIGRANEPLKKFRIGFDNSCLSSSGWPWEKFLHYSALNKCKVFFADFSTMVATCTNTEIQDLKAFAQDLQITIFTGNLCICPSSVEYKDVNNSAEKNLIDAIRAAKKLHSPSIRIFLGSQRDRRSKNAISSRIKDGAKTLKSVGRYARESGVKLAISSNNGDLRSEDLLKMVNDLGDENVGINFDSGNPILTLEDPLDAFHVLRERIISFTLKDYKTWSAPGGAEVVWTAIGEGMVYWKKLVMWAEATCPGIPVFLRLNSGFLRKIDFHSHEFWTITGVSSAYIYCIRIRKSCDEHRSREAFLSKGRPTPK